MYKKLGYFIKILDMGNEKFAYEFVYDKPKSELDFFYY